MGIQVTGTIDRQGFGTGTWALVTVSGETYELYQSPKDLHKAGLRVRVSGTIRQDIATIAMIGPVLEVQGFEVMP
jgi:hypothetical protein